MSCRRSSDSKPPKKVTDPRSEETDDTTLTVRGFAHREVPRAELGSAQARLTTTARRRSPTSAFRPWPYILTDPGIAPGIERDKGMMACSI